MVAVQLSGVPCRPATPAAIPVPPAALPPLRLAQGAAAGGCGCSGGSSSAAARGQQAAAAAADHQLNGLMGSMEGTLSREDIMEAWQSSAPRQASAAGGCGSAGPRRDKPAGRWQ